MVSSYYRGHLIESIDGDKWVYTDTKEAVNDKRPCGYCGKSATSEGHDACLGNLPGLMNACCGHGGKHEGVYIQFIDGVCIRGEDAKTIIGILKRSRK